MDTTHGAGYPPVTIILGTGRSGTEYLVHLMRTCFGIGFPSEPKFIQNFYHQLKSTGELNDVSDMADWAQRIVDTQSIQHLQSIRGRTISPQEILDRARYGNTYASLMYGFLELVAELRDETPHLGYKDPKDVDAIPILLEVFPSAKLINIIRDGRDVASSFRRFTWGPKNHFTAARYWKHGVDQSRIDGANAGDRYLELRYEDLVLESETTTERIVNFMDYLPHVRGKGDEFLEMLNTTKKLSSINRWKSDTRDSEIRVFESVAGDTLEELGYELRFSERLEINKLNELRFRFDNARKKTIKYVRNPSRIVKTLNSFR